MIEKKLVNQNENLSILIWKLVIGSTLSWKISELFGSDHPYLAPLSVIICLQTTMSETTRLSILRVLGTIIGICVTVLIARYLPINGWSLGLLLLIGCFITKWLKFDKTTIHQVSITILFVFVFENRSKQYAFDRMRDTLVGVLVTALIQIVWFRLILKNKKQSQ